MPERLAARIADLLASSDEPLSSPEIASRLDAAPEEVDRAIWARPSRFAWQPGHRWALNIEKRPAGAETEVPERTDARAAPLAPRESVQLRAITLTSGVTLRVSQRPIDSSAIFTVDSRGSELLLVLNSSHPVFATHPIPFASDTGDDTFRGLIELLLEAWALYEDGVPAAEGKRRLEETRMMWGRRVAQLLAEGA